jgi:type IV pilus biogenesis protein CpaD/CtpE
MPPYPILLPGLALLSTVSVQAQQVPPAPRPDPVAAAPRMDPTASGRCAVNPAAFGCANGANLAAMASPEDLLSGRPKSPSPGPVEAAAVARLFADKVKDLRREGTESGGGGPQ